MEKNRKMHITIDWSADKTLAVFEFIESLRDALYHEYGDEVSNVIHQICDTPAAPDRKCDTTITLSAHNSEPATHWLYKFQPAK